MKIRLFLLIIGASLLSLPAYAKRSAAPALSSIEKEGHRYFYEYTYSQEKGSNYSVNILCKNIQTGKILWKTLIYDREIDRLVESDIQHILLKRFTLENRQLVAEDEKGTVYRIDAATGQLIEPLSPHHYPRINFKPSP
jgi:glucose dehydrogenase